MSQQARKRKLLSRKRPRIQRRTAPGAIPGTMQPRPESKAPRVHVIAYGPGEIWERNVPDVPSIPTPDERLPVVWINVDGLGDVATLQKIADRYKLHLLAMEDVVNVHQRAKVEMYDQVDFIVARMLHRRTHLESEQISIFLGQGFVITFQEDPEDCLEQVRARIRSADNRLRQSGPDYLVYALLDAVIDHYFPFLDQYADRLDELEDRINKQYGQSINEEVHNLRSELLLLRRTLRPHREMIAQLSRDDSPRVTSTTRIFLRDCYDHTMQLLDLLETYREMCSDLRELQMSMASHRMNEVMKLLTIISTTFIPLSFITGIYGMNFDTSKPWNMPELNWPFGYALVWGIMVAVAAGMVAMFYRKGWFTS